MTIGEVSAGILKNSFLPNDVVLALRSTAGVEISQNPHLDTEVCVQWVQSSKKLKLDVACNLYRRPYSAAQAAKLIAAEQRVRPLLALLEANANNPDVVDLFEKTVATKSLLSKLVHVAAINPEALLGRIDELEPVNRLRLLNRLSPEQLSSADLVGYLQGANDWDFGKAGWSRYAVATSLTNFRADFLSAVLQSGTVAKFLHLAIAASPWIRDDTAELFLSREPDVYALRELVGNPWVSKGILERVAGLAKSGPRDDNLRVLLRWRLAPLSEHAAFTAEPWELPRQQFLHAWRRVSPSELKPAGRPQLGLLLARHENIPQIVQRQMQESLRWFPDVVEGASWAVEESRNTFAANYPLLASGAVPETGWDECAERARRTERILAAQSAPADPELQRALNRVLDEPADAYYGQTCVLDAAFLQFSEQVGESVEAWVFVAEFAGTLGCTLRELASVAKTVASK